VSESLNQWEPEPFDTVAEYYDPRFDFGPEVGFDERMAVINEILETEAEAYDEYAEPEEPEPSPQKELIPDDGLRTAFNEIVTRFIADLKADGIELPTFLDSLIVTETERLKIRRFCKKDLNALFGIMKKVEVMYAWESGFTKAETRKWINRQYTRYHKDGYGYFAVTLKESDKLIGQAGLIRQDLNGENVVELGYIFDDAYWGQGYAIEAVRACVEIALNQFGINQLFATIRPNNAASVKLAEKLGMLKTGENIIIYKGIEMPHDIYLLENMPNS
jgi:RimJ/RimL family protein N-acetyltransferase